MGLTKIKRGLDLPINGKPNQKVTEGNNVRHVALLGDDYVGMRPMLMVEEGEHVKKGQVLFTDKKNPRVKFTSPGCGKVTAINRGAKRKFLSLVIELNGGDEILFTQYTENALDTLDRDKIITQMADSGLWTSLRTRPFSKIADPDSNPHSIFVTAMDTRPLSPDVNTILNGKENDFVNGLKVLSRLTEGKLYLCKKPGTNIPQAEIPSLVVEEFDGKHPAGNAGTHIHFLDPVYRNKTVWTVDAQDVCAIGSLFTTGHINTDRIIALAGASVKEPRLVKTRIGASIDELVEDQLVDGVHRIISGDVLSGRKAEDATAFLGRYHQQVSVIPEFTDLGFFGWLSLGFDRYSVKRVVLSRLNPKKRFDFHTAMFGGERAIVPIGSYEQVMALDLLPTHLLRALACDDIEEAEKLGCLELDEEDLALCSFVCQSKINHGENLRRNLTTIEKEG